MVLLGAEGAAGVAGPLVDQGVRRGGDAGDVDALAAVNGDELVVLAVAECGDGAEGEHLVGLAVAGPRDDGGAVGGGGARAVSRPASSVEGAGGMVGRGGPRGGEVDGDRGVGGVRGSRRARRREPERRPRPSPRFSWSCASRISLRGGSVRPSRGSGAAQRWCDGTAWARTQGDGGAESQTADAGEWLRAGRTGSPENVETQLRAVKTWNGMNRFDSRRSFPCRNSDALLSDSAGPESTSR
jgi:hypothetical protein